MEGNNNERKTIIIAIAAIIIVLGAIFTLRRLNTRLRKQHPRRKIRVRTKASEQGKSTIRRKDCQTAILTTPKPILLKRPRPTLLKTFTKILLADNFYFYD